MWLSTEKPIPLQPPCQPFLARFILEENTAWILASQLAFLAGEEGNKRETENDVLLCVQIDSNYLVMHDGVARFQFYIGLTSLRFRYTITPT